MNKELAKTIGTGARQARKALELTQEDIAERIGVSVEFYARIERGTSLPSIVTFARIASALGASGDMLLGRHQPAAVHGSAWVAPQTTDRPEIRRIVRRLRNARPGTLRLVSMLLKEFENLQDTEKASKGASGDSGADSSGSSGTDSGVGSNDGGVDPRNSSASSAEGETSSVADERVSKHLVDDVSERTPISSTDGLIAASKALGVEPAGMRSVGSQRRVFAYGTTSSVIGE